MQRLQTIHAVGIVGDSCAVYCYGDEKQACDAFDFAAQFGAMAGDTVSLFAFCAPIHADPEQCKAQALRQLLLGAIHPIKVRAAE